MQNKATDELSVAATYKSELLDLLDDLVLQADSGLQQSIKNSEKVRDIIGKVHHAIHGVDIDRVTNPGDGPTPLDPMRRCSQSQ